MKPIILPIGAIRKTISRDAKIKPPSPTAKCLNPNLVKEPGPKTLLRPFASLWVQYNGDEEPEKSEMPEEARKPWTIGRSILKSFRGVLKSS